MRIPKVMMLAGIWLVFFCGSAWAENGALLFDKPLRKDDIPLPPDPYNPQSKPMLSCFYYPNMMVKQIDMGEKGAQRLSMIYVQKGTEQPPCRPEPDQNEMKLSYWEGYFWGVKGNYVFFEGSDSWGSGNPFAIFTAHGGKLFQDVVADYHSVELMVPVQASGRRLWHENPVVLRYRKVYLAPCSLRADEQRCWSTIRQATGLSQTTAPDCSASYVQSEKGATPDQLASIRANPSMIQYNVEVVLDGNGVTRLFPVGAVDKCYAAP